ncbi:hypothetical protein ZIOFF_027624 [Zingiber officinale]|uniref:Uncharacterized protein n=1 Tax=Zingiber officinale TaxID=94328 RepID=A0A8J5L8G3_ZINOF|nr:hypothetical protein ZIOFF_027624 [Zingiber officinale]
MVPLPSNKFRRVEELASASRSPNTATQMSKKRKFVADGAFFAGSRRTGTRASKSVLHGCGRRSSSEPPGRRIMYLAEFLRYKLLGSLAVRRSGPTTPVPENVTIHPPKEEDEMIRRSGATGRNLLEL